MSPPGRDRTLFWTMAVACFTAALVCLGARAVDRSTRGAEDARAGYMIVRVTSEEEAGLNAALAALGADARVAEARIMSNARAAELLQSAGAPSADLPPLRLIEVTLTPDAAGLAPADLTSMLSDQGVSAETFGPPVDVEANARASRLQRAALAGALALCAVMALIVLLAARALAGRRRDQMIVLADLGATRETACLRIADEAGGSGFIAGVLGALGAGGAALAALLTVMPDLGGQRIEHIIAPADIAPLIALPFLAALAAGIGARLGAETLYARAARLR